MPSVERPIRVLVWIPAGMQRAIVVEALAGQHDMEVLPETAPAREQAASASATLEATVQARVPDVVISLIAAEQAQALTRRLAAPKLILISSDGRSAFAHTDNISADAIRRIVRASAEERTRSTTSI